MTQNIKIIKLLNGQDLLGEITGQTETTIKIKNPVAIVVVPSRTDPKTPSVGFAPWAEFSDDKEIALASQHVLAIMTPIKEFISQYNATFGGIVMPTNKLIIPGA
jgi:hypothetical protein